MNYREWEEILRINEQINEIASTPAIGWHLRGRLKALACDWLLYQKDCEILPPAVRDAIEFQFGVAFRRAAEAQYSARA